MSDERQRFGSDQGDEAGPLSAEDKRLEALLANMPRRSCPEHVRKSVLAALRREMDIAASAAHEPKAKVVSLWMRRRVFLALQAAAFVAIAVVALKIYYGHRDRDRREIFTPSVAEKMAEPESDSRAVAWPYQPKPAVTAAEKPAALKPSAPAREMAELRDRERGGLAGGPDKLEEKKPTPVGERLSLADEAKAADAKYGKATPTKLDPTREAGREKGRGELKSKTVESLAITPEKVSPAATAGAIPSATYPGVAVVDSLKTAGLPAAPETAAPRTLPALEPAVRAAAAAPPAALAEAEKPAGAVPKESEEMLRALEREGEKTSRPTAFDEAAVTAVTGLQVIEIAASPSVQAKIVALNVIRDIQASESQAQPTAQDEKATTWTAFSQRALASFGQLIGGFSGTINGAEEVLLMPGSRRALMVECSVPATKAGALMDGVNQKRMVAVASDDRARRLGVGRILWQGGPDTYSNVQRVRESELRGRISGPTTNYYVQAPPANIAQNYVNQRSQLAQQRAPSQQVFFGAGRAGGAPTTGAYGGYGGLGSQQTTTVAGQVGQQLGQQIDRDRAQRAGQTVLYFVLEPDQLPTPVTLSK